MAGTPRGVHWDEFSPVVVSVGGGDAGDRSSVDFTEAGLGRNVEATCDADHRDWDRSGVLHCR